MSDETTEDLLILLVQTVARERLGDPDFAVTLAERMDGTWLIARGHRWAIEVARGRGEDSPRIRRGTREVGDWEEVEAFTDRGART